MRNRVAMLCLCAASMAAGPATGQVDRPDGSMRVVRSWDFEPVDGILVPVPEHWFRGHDTTKNPRPGFPPWNKPALDEGSGVDGSWSLKLPTDGGSASIKLARGVVPVFADADYAVTAMVRTEGLRVAGAVVAARFVDDDLEPIESTEIRSRPIDTDGAWRSIHLQLRGHPEAQSVQIELMLLQPAQRPGFKPGAHDATAQDLDGASYIDNLVVYQTPQVEMRINGKGNIIESPARPELSMRVRDLAGERLNVAVTLYGIEGSVIDTHTRRASAGGQDMRWEPPINRYGWYRAVMDVRNEKGLIGRSYLDFAWLPEADAERAELATSPDDRRRFGVTMPTRPRATGYTDSTEPSLVPHLLEELHTGTIAMPAWAPEGEAVDSGAFDRMIEQLLEDGHEIAFILDELPPGVASAMRVDRTSLLTVLGGEDERWVESISRLLSRFGERIRTWQIGAEGSSDPYYRDDLSRVVERVRGAIFGRVPKPAIRLPWRVEQPVSESGGADELSVYLPANVRSEKLGEYEDAWRDRENATLVVELPDRERFSPRDRVIEMVRRLTLARAYGAGTILIRAPWVRHTDSGRSGEEQREFGELMPAPEFAAMRQLSDALANRQIVGELREVEGARVFIAQGERSSMLIGWNESSDPRDAVVSGYLGEQTILVRDPFGNATESIPNGGEHKIGLRDMPVYVEGIDVELARFRAGLALDPRFIQSEARKHYVDLVMTNPWDMPISGRIRFKEPEAWKITPRVLNFQLGPEETERFELSLVLSGGEEAGPRRVLTEVELIAMREYPIFEVPIQVEVGLDDIELRVSYRIEDEEGDGKPDVVVTAVVTNVSDRPKTLRAIAVAPGQASEHRSISGLMGGQTVVRTFLFEDASDALKGETIRVGLREQNGPGRLNRSLQLPE